MIDLVFYGEKPTVSNFRPIKNNQGWSKPQGGLWTSPMIKGNISAWKYWCDSQHMSCPNQRWHVIMSDACRIIEADENLDNIKPYLVKTDSAGLNYVIDFEKMAEDFDFLYISNETVKQHKNGVFAGFDVPTGLFLNIVDKNSHKLLFKGLDDVEFESFKAKCPEAPEEIDIKPQTDVDLQNDPVLKRLFEDVTGKNGDAAQIRALALLCKTLSGSR